MTLAYTNNGQSTLAASLSASATELTVAANDGKLFPDIDADDGDWFPLTLVAVDGSGFEVVRATSRSGDLIVIERAQENTGVALAFPAGAIVSHRMTAAAFDAFIKDGDETVNLPSGINLAEQINASSIPYEVDYEPVPVQFDGFRMFFKVVAFNTNEDNLSPRLVYNGGEAKSIRTGWQAGIVPRSSMRTGRYVELVWSETDDYWLMESPVRQTPNNANTIAAGILSVPSAPNIYYDPDFSSNFDVNPVDDSRYAMGRDHVSQIIDNWQTQQDEAARRIFPPMWTEYGNGALGDNVVAGNVSLFGGFYYTYETFTLQSTGVVTCSFGNSVIIRATDTIVINGTVILPTATATSWPLKHVGPAAAPTVQGHTGLVPQYVPQQELAVGSQSPGESLFSGQMFNAVLQGVSLAQFHGAHGRGHIAGNEPDAHVKAHGGLILIAPRVFIQEDAKLFLPTRGTNANPNTLTSGTGDVVANTSRAAGGMVVCAADTFSVNASSEWKVEKAEDAWKTYSQVNLSDGSAKAAQVDGAAPGMLWNVSLDGNSTNRLI